jgi:hypothetical protein
MMLTEGGAPPPGTVPATAPPLNLKIEEVYYLMLEVVRSKALLLFAEK